MIPGTTLTWNLPNPADLTLNDGKATLVFSISASGPNDSLSVHEQQIELEFDHQINLSSMTAENLQMAIRSQLSKNREQDRTVMTIPMIQQKVMMDITEQLTQDCSLTWSIADLVRDRDTGLVTEVIYDLLGTSPGPQGRADRHQFLMLVSGDPTDSGFTPYSDLTQDQVLSWVWDHMDKMYLEGDGMESRRYRECNMRVQLWTEHIKPLPVMKNGVPW